MTLLICFLEEESKTRNHRSRSRVLQNTTDDQVSLTTNTSLSQSNSLSPMTKASEASVTNTNDNSLMMRLLPSLTSCFNRLIQYLSLMSQQLKSYSFKTTFILLLFIILLVFHSFYLIQLAYRIEDRLHSLYQRWPSSSMKSGISSSSLKNSLPSSKDF